MNKTCPDCGIELLQVLVRKQVELDTSRLEVGYNDLGAKHYGYLCEKCKQLYRLRWELEKIE